MLPEREERVAAEGHVLQRAQKMVLFLLAQGFHSTSVRSLKAVLPERELVGSDVALDVAHLVYINMVNHMHYKIHVVGA